MKMVIGNAVAVAILGLSAALFAAPNAFAADREIRIGPDAKWVNVTHDETVRFVTSNGKSFTYRFDTGNAFAIELNKVAPAGVLGNQRITAYIAPCLRQSSGS